MRFLATLAALVVLATAVIAIACGGDDETAPEVSADGLDVVEVRLNDEVIRAEYAWTPDQRSKGLSGRESLAADAGMLFDFGKQHRASFWMKDTNLALDMVWIDENRVVVDVTPNVQPQPGVPDSELIRYSPKQGARYVLEVNGGVAASAGIEEGDVLDFSLPHEEDT